MSVRVGDLLFHEWQSLELPGGWSDTFVFRMSPTDGLPPGDYADVVRLMAVPLRRLRPAASLWVQIEHAQLRGEYPAAAGFSPIPGGGVSEGKATGMQEADWYQAEVRHALRGLPVPFAVTKRESPPQLWDFSHFPRLDRSPFPRPPSAGSYLKEEPMRPSELACLRVLARADCAYTAEVASLAGLSRTGARIALAGLQERRLVEFQVRGKFPLWKLQRSGLSLALRSWGLPPGSSFQRRKERGRDACTERAQLGWEENGPLLLKERVIFAGKEQVSFLKNVRSSVGSGRGHPNSGRHRRTARLWPAWLRSAWPQVDIWTGWSEVSCGSVRPDALAWGRVGGYETLFWLEVESGNVSLERLERKTRHRINQALLYARRNRIHLVFTILAQPWVRQELARILCNLPPDLCILLGDWLAFGSLPKPEWGRVRLEREGN